MTAIEQDLNRATALPPSFETSQVVISPRIRSLLYLTDVLGGLKRPDIWKLALGMYERFDVSSMASLSDICLQVGLTVPGNEDRVRNDPFLRHVVPLYYPSEITANRLIMYRLNKRRESVIGVMPRREIALASLMRRDLEIARRYRLIVGWELLKPDSSIDDFGKPHVYKVIPECNGMLEIISGGFKKNSWRLDRDSVLTGFGKIKAVVLRPTSDYTVPGWMEALLESV